MALKTVTQLMQSMAPHLNGDNTAPTTSGDEYNLWLEALNQAQDDWAEVDYDWLSLRKTLNTTVLQSGTSLGLPTDFVKLAGYPTFLGKEYPEVRMEEMGRFDTSAAFITVDLNNKALGINPALASTMAASIRYYSRPTSLATTTSTSLCPSDNFLIYRASAHILLGRDSGKYSELLDKSNTALVQMIGKEVHVGEQMDTSIKNELQTKHSFTLGVD